MTCWEVGCFLSTHGLAGTKRWMSDPEFAPKMFLYLPAVVAARVAQAPPPPGTIQALALVYCVVFSCHMS